MNAKRHKNFKPEANKMSSSYKKIKGEGMSKSVHDTSKRKKDPETDDSSMSASGNTNSLSVRKQKSKHEEKPSPSPSEKSSNFKKLIDYDEFQEINDFLSFLEELPQKTPQKKKAKEENETEFDVLKRESKKLTHMAFGLFDKIGLSFDNFRSRPGVISAPSSGVKMKEPEKMEKEKTDIESEEKTEEPKPKSQSKPKKNIKDLLKIDLYTDYDGEIDDRLKTIHFEPTLERMRTSNHIDLEEVAPLIEQTRKKDTGKEAEDLTTQKVSLESLNENYQKINELVEGVSEADLQRLEPEVYLNDTLINFYLKFIEYGLISAERRAKIHIFNTYFMPKMRKLFNEVGNDFSKFDKVHEKLERWTKKIDLFEKDFILMPINENEHWDMLILCYPGKLYSKDSDFPFVIYLDSLCRMEDIYAKMLYHFFAREVKTKKPDELPTVQSKLRTLQSSSFPFYQPMVPKQCNWTDCGLYLLQYTEMFADDESYILNDLEELNKTRWFPRKLISDKREDMKKLIRDLKQFKYDTIPEYIERRNKRRKDYAKSKDQYDTFDQKGFEMALALKYSEDYLAEEEIAILKLDYYYFGSLEFEQPDGMHI